MALTNEIIRQKLIEKFGEQTYRLGRALWDAYFYF